MSLSDRLRGIVSPLNGPSQKYVGRASEDIAETLGGTWNEHRGHRYLVVDRKYGPGHRHGRIAIADAMPGSDDSWPRLSLLSRTPVSGRLLFFDLETTGLAGGAGTYAFLVGCGFFDGPVFRVRQFFLSSFNAEAALLAGVEALASESGAIVTFNGKSFDLPLIDNRFVIHRMPSSLCELPHIDLLHPARRFWRDHELAPSEYSYSRGLAPSERSESRGCRLPALERTQCGFEREGDVPGFEIPSRYFAYVRSGNAQPLEAVLEHNRLDLISLALLTARTAHLLEEGVTAARSAREALGLGRIYEQGGLMAEARKCFAAASGIEEWRTDSITRAEALRAYALLSRRDRKYDDAAGAWRQLLQIPQCPSTIAREATEALAIHHEHRLRDAASARQFASQALLFPSTPARVEAARYRLARLDRKVSAQIMD